LAPLALIWIKATRMPCMDRLELIAEARLFGRKTPTVMITGSIDPAIERRVAALG
jgi:CheY-like chemotaxis protein